MDYIDNNMICRGAQVEILHLDPRMRLKRRKGKKMNLRYTIDGQVPSEIKIMPTEKDRSVSMSHKPVKRQACPECGSPMEIVDHRQECETLFIWYRCMEAGCDDEWLKTINDYHTVMKKVI